MKHLITASLSKQIKEGNRKKAIKKWKEKLNIAKTKFCHAYKIKSNNESIFTMIWVGLIMNKWACFGGEGPHAQNDGGGFLFFFSPGTPSWRMMQCNPSPWRPQIVAYSISLHTVCSCHQWLLCRLCLQTRSKLEGGGAKPVKVKRTRGIMSSLTGRRGGRWREGSLS